MKLGLVGLGRMGANMARRLRRAGLEVVGWNRRPEVTEALARETGLHAAGSLEALVAALPPPRVVWLMLPAGEVTERHIERLTPLLETGDILVDGANSYYRDSMRRARALAARGIHFVDVGVSGGIWGLEQGYALMAGGSKEAIERLAPVLRSLAPAPDKGWLHCGPAGAGHFVKMVHNGIEYGLMQAYAEGFALLAAEPDFALDLAAIAETWRHGSVIRSWLLDLTAAALAEDARLADIEPFVADSGEGRWTVEEAVRRGVPVPVTAAALMARFTSQGQGDYAMRLLSVMRRQFGGHAPKKRETP